MSTLSQIEQDIAALQSAGQAAASELAVLAAQVSTLKANGAGAVTGSDLQALDANVQAITTVLLSATQNAGTDPQQELTTSGTSTEAPASGTEEVASPTTPDSTSSDTTNDPAPAG